jgi:hypothetical protein
MCAVLRMVVFCKSAHACLTGVLSEYVHTYGMRSRGFWSHLSLAGSPAVSHSTFHCTSVGRSLCFNNFSSCVIGFLLFSFLSVFFLYLFYVHYKRLIRTQASTICFCDNWNTTFLIDMLSLNVFGIRLGPCLFESKSVRCFEMSGISNSAVYCISTEALNPQR